MQPFKIGLRIAFLTLLFLGITSVSTIGAEKVPFAQKMSNWWKQNYSESSPQTSSAPNYMAREELA